MRLSSLFLAPSIILGASLNSNDDLDGLHHIELQKRFAKTLLGSIKPNELKQNKFCFIIWYPGGGVIPENFNIHPVHIISYFMYSPTDKCIIVNYVPFFGSDNFYAYDIKEAPVNNFMRETVRRKIVNPELISQLKLPLPNGLQNDVLFNKMRKRPKLSGILIDEAEGFEFGFKSSKTEIHLTSVSYYEFSPRVYTEIIKPVIDAIGKHETEKQLRKNLATQKKPGHFSNSKFSKELNTSNNPTGQ
jgi:hypothetical protein